MQRVPESERYYHWIEGNRMTFHRFDETNLIDRRINECKYRCKYFSYMPYSALRNERDIPELLHRVRESFNGPVEP